MFVLNTCWLISHIFVQVVGLTFSFVICLLMSNNMEFPKERKKSVSWLWIEASL